MKTVENRLFSRRNGVYPIIIKLHEIFTIFLLIYGKAVLIMGIVDLRRMRMDNQNNRNNKNNPKNNRQGWGVILVTTLLTAFLVMGLFSMMQGKDPEEISYDKFLKMVDEKKVEKVTIDSTKIYITLTEKARTEAIEKNAEGNAAAAELLGQLEEKTAGKRDSRIILPALSEMRIFPIVYTKQEWSIPSIFQTRCHR